MARRTRAGRRAVGRRAARAVRARTRAPRPGASWRRLLALPERAAHRPRRGRPAALVPGRARAAPPRPAATSRRVAELARRREGPATPRGARGRHTTRGPSSASSGSAFRHAARYYLEVARTSRPRPRRSSSGASIIETPEARRRGVPPGRRVDLRLPPLRRRSSCPACTSPTASGRTLVGADGDVDDPPSRRWFERTRGAAGRPDRRAARRPGASSRRRCATGEPVGIVADRDLAGGGIADRRSSAHRRRSRSDRPCSRSRRARRSTPSASGGWPAGRVRGPARCRRGRGRRARGASGSAATLTAMARRVRDADRRRARAVVGRCFFPIWPDLAASRAPTDRTSRRRARR